MSSKPKKQNSLQPKLRFPEFRGAKAWEKKPLEEFLDYKQPTPYLVADTNYSNDYDTPVLTAGKTFLLGYTNERHGIFEDNLPVIIFDDFTTATQFVDFPFKAKSSAMKILQAKNGASIKFMYEAMQMISYEVGTHERHWISKFAPMQIPMPLDPKEQQKIADCLSSLDELIASEDQKLDTLQRHKKGLMQELFPAEGETLPNSRFPEFSTLGEWEKKPLGVLAHFASGGTPSKDNPDYWNGTIPWISASSMYDVRLNKSELKVTPLAIKHGTRIAKKGSLLILVRGSMLYNRIPMGIATIDVAFNQDVKALTPDKGVDAEFLLHQMLAYESRISVDKTGIGAGKIETAELKNLTINVPKNIKEQQKIANFFSSIDNIIAAQAQKLDAIRSHKQALMQQLFPSVSEGQE